MHTISRHFPNVARILLGLVFFVFGLNGFLQFMPQPPIPGPAGAFLGALASSGYLVPLLKGTEVLAGLLLLTRRAVPFALVLLAPILLNIAAFHLFLAPTNAWVALFLVALEGYLAWHHRGAYAPLFGRRPDAEVGPSLVQRTGGV